MNINPTEDEKISSKGDSSSEDGCSEDEVEVVTVQIRFTAHILINTANNLLGLKRATQGQSVCEDFTILTNDPSRLLSDPESREKKQTTSAAKLLYFFRAASCEIKARATSTMEKVKTLLAMTLYCLVQRMQ